VDCVCDDLCVSSSLLCLSEAREGFCITLEWKGACWRCVGTTSESITGTRECHVSDSDFCYSH